MIMWLALCGAIMFALVGVTPIEAQTVAVFDFELIDTSLEGESAPTNTRASSV